MDFTLVSSIGIFLKIRFALFCALLLAISYPVSSYLEEHFTSQFYARINKSFGDAGEQRARAWQKILVESQDSNDWNKINKVNRFVNENVSYEDDLLLWGKKDYWASPIETIGGGRGDCEDYAIAKFFSLTALGVPEEKLRLMYVRQLDVNQPHMVLIYFEHRKAIPLVLDNFNKRILPANKRGDLKPIYSFNGAGLWMSKAKGLGRKVKGSRGVSAWTKLIKRIEQGEINVFASR